MALPVSLTSGWASIILQVSPNGITAINEGNEPIILFGLISSVTPNGRPELASGQNVIFETKQNQKKVIYSNDTYYLVKQEDIIFIENPVT